MLPIVTLGGGMLHHVLTATCISILFVIFECEREEGGSTTEHTVVGPAACARSFLDVGRKGGKL